MSETFLVEMPDGTFVRKDKAALQPDDMVVFDGESLASARAAQAALEEEIAAAGGIEAWKQRPQ